MIKRSSPLLQRLQPDLWREIRARHKMRSLRELAAEYGVSHEAVRRTLEAEGTRERRNSPLQA